MYIKIYFMHLTSNTTVCPYTPQINTCTLLQAVIQMKEFYMAKDITMADALSKLIEASRNTRMTSEQQEEQRRSFAYGNAGLENDLITRDMIDDQAQKLKRENG